MSTTSLPSLSSGLIEQLQQIITARLSLHPAGSRLGLFWPIRTCSICEVPYGFHFGSSGEPYFDGACDCANLGLQRRTWADVAELYLQQPQLQQWWAFGPPVMPAEVQAGLLLSRVQLMYHGYGAAVHYRNHIGNPMPDFEQLPDKVQAAWVASYCLSRLITIGAPA